MKYKVAGALGFAAAAAAAAADEEEGGAGVVCIGVSSIVMVGLAFLFAVKTLEVLGD